MSAIAKLLRGKSEAEKLDEQIAILQAQKNRLEVLNQKKKQLHELVIQVERLQSGVSSSQYSGRTLSGRRSERPPKRNTNNRIVDTKGENK